MNSDNQTRNVPRQQNEYEYFILNGLGVPGLNQNGGQQEASSSSHQPPADYQTQLQEYYHNYYNNYYQKAMKSALTSGLSNPNSHHRHSSNPLGVPPPPPAQNSNHLSSTRSAGDNEDDYRQHSGRNHRHSGDLTNYFHASERVSSSLGIHNTATHSGNNFISSSLGRQPKKSNLIYHQPRHVTSEPLVIHQSADLAGFNQLQQQQQQPQQIILNQNGQLEIVQQSIPALFQFINGGNNAETLINSNGGVLNTNRYKLLTRNQQVFIDSGTSGALPALINVPQQQQQQATFALPTLLANQQIQPTTVRFASPLVEQSVSATARSVILPRIESMRGLSAASNGWVNLTQPQQQQQPFVLSAATNEPLRQILLQSLANQPSAQQQLVYKL
jgi:hypothetical protein